MRQLTRLVPAVASGLLVVALLAGCATPDGAPEDHDMQATLAFLKDRLEAGEGPFTSHLVAIAGLHDPWLWPDPHDPGHSLAARLVYSPAMGNGTLLMLTHAMAVAGLDVRTFFDDDLVQEVWRLHDGEQFADPVSIVDDILALRALAAAGEPADQLSDAAVHVRGAQADDGSWTYPGAVRGNVDITAWALLALAEADALAAGTRDAAVAFLSAHQDGGRYVGEQEDENCQSTALAVQALAAVDAAVDSGSLAYLAQCRNEDAGYGVVPGAASQVWVTADVLVALRSLHQ